jgi:hypothetical protein
MTTKTDAKSTPANAKEVVLTFVNALNDVCLLYDIDMSGTKIFTCGWYQIKDSKIKLLKVVFDPRPLLEKADKK